MSVILSQVMGFLVNRKTGNTITFSTKATQIALARSTQLKSGTANEAPQWVIEGGDTSETECSSSADMSRAATASILAAETARMQAEESEKKAVEDQIRANRVAAAAAIKAEEAKKAVIIEQPKSILPVVFSATVEAPKQDLTKLSVGTDGFDVGLLIAFPIIVATLGFFFLFPLIGPQLAATLPPVPAM